MAASSLTREGGFGGVAAGQGHWGAHVRFQIWVSVLLARCRLECRLFVAASESPLRACAGCACLAPGRTRSPQGPLVAGWAISGHYRSGFAYGLHTRGRQGSRLARGSAPFCRYTGSLPHTGRLRVKLVRAMQWLWGLSGPLNLMYLDYAQSTGNTSTLRPYTRSYFRTMPKQASGKGAYIRGYLYKGVYIRALCAYGIHGYIGSTWVYR